ncbi:hypothetical protein FQN57_006900 [Myotisia sp. PD_48]|nr:hypothetical protein FQN57_006900 [Myotisia sp. PD_48]
MGRKVKVKGQQQVSYSKKYSTAMSDSDGGDIRDAKKREYNRNAQRMFRKRRKEHMKRLELDTEELERLKIENADLRQKNDSLLRFGGSACSSPRLPGTNGTHSPSPLLSIEHLVPGPFGQMISRASPPYIFGSTNALQTSLNMHPSPCSSVVAATIEPSSPDRYCLITPLNLSQVRVEMHSRFHPLLNIVQSNGAVPEPHLHYITLAGLAPSLPDVLKPTPLQLSVPHNAYIDLLPSQMLRNALIRLGVTTSTAFLDEVCPFLYDGEDHGQLIIWGEYLNEMAWQFSDMVLDQWQMVLSPVWRERANFWQHQQRSPPNPSLTSFAL